MKQETAKFNLHDTLYNNSGFTTNVVDSTVYVDTGKYESALLVGAAPQAHHDITFHGENGPIVTIKPNGEVIYGKGYTFDKFAVIFWEGIAGINPMEIKDKFHKVQEENARLKVLLNKAMKQLAKAHQEGLLEPLDE